MTTAEMATYGYDQINQARAEPNTVSKSTISKTVSTAATPALFSQVALSQ